MVISCHITYFKGLELFNSLCCIDSNKDVENFIQKYCVKVKNKKIIFNDNDFFVNKNTFINLNTTDIPFRLKNNCFIITLNIYYNKNFFNYNPTFYIYNFNPKKFIFYIIQIYKMFNIYNIYYYKYSIICNDNFKYFLSINYKKILNNYIIIPKKIFKLKKLLTNVKQIKKTIKIIKIIYIL